MSENRLHVPSFDRIRPAYQQVADQLMGRILDGSLATGDRLPAESDLAVAFGASRSTVREALRVLASRDLIVTSRGTTGGSFVARAEAEQVSAYLETSIGLMSGGDGISLDHMLEAREMVEVPAARLAAARREQGHIEQLHEAIEVENRAGGRSERFERNKHFHGIVLEASGNTLFALVNEPVFRVLRARFSKPEMPAEYWQMVREDHAEVVRLIEERDQDGAAAAMHAHLERIRPAYHATARAQARS